MGEEEKEIKYGMGAYLTEMDNHPGDLAMLKGFQIGTKGAFAGFVYGSAVAALFPVPAGQIPLLHALKVAGINSMLLGGAGATFAITTTVVTKLRDKDDYKSWAIGAGTAGSLFGFKYRSIAVGCRAAFGLAVLAAAVKYTNVYRAPFHDAAEFFRTPREES